MVDIDDYEEEEKEADEEFHLSVVPYRLPTYLSPFELGTTNLVDPPRLQYGRFFYNFQEFFAPVEPDDPHDQWPCLMLPLFSQMPPAFARLSPAHAPLSWNLCTCKGWGARFWTLWDSFLAYGETLYLSRSK